MKNPSADQAIQIIDDLVNKTLNTQNAFEKDIEKLLDEAMRIKATADDFSVPLSNSQTRELVLNISHIIRELGMVEKGFGKPIPKAAPHQQKLYGIDASAMKQ